MILSFKRATGENRHKLFSWLDKPHVQEFWDNSQAHRDDIETFMEGRKEYSPYFAGIFEYWVGSADGDDFCLVMSSKVSADDDIPELWIDHLSASGTTASLDFLIGEESFLGIGLAGPTLEAFINFYKAEVDPCIETIIIDPDKSNPKAIKAYTNAGFVAVGDFFPKSGVFEGLETVLMIKTL